MKFFSVNVPRNRLRSYMENQNDYHDFGRIGKMKKKYKNRKTGDE